jgi:hypothetical protein
VENEAHKAEKQEINVRVITSSGHYPEHGHEKVPLAEHVKDILARAATSLGIVDTAQWVANVNGALIDVSQMYVQLGLHGEATIDYGRSEGGGG